MNAYEITFIVRPDLEDEQTRAVIDQVNGRIESSGGEIIATFPWNPARRRMAYPIRDFGDGVYITTDFNFDPQTLREFENGLKLNERILRFLVVQATELNVKTAQQRMAHMAAQAAQAAAPPPPPVPGQDAPIPAGAPASQEAAAPSTQTAAVAEPVEQAPATDEVALAEAVPAAEAPAVAAAMPSTESAAPPATAEPIAPEPVAVEPVATETPVVEEPVANIELPEAEEPVAAASQTEE